eukprot:gene14709-16238_t
MSIKIISLNVHDLRSFDKCQDLILWLGTSYFDMIYIQETHFTGKADTVALSRIWEGQSYFSFGSNHSAGVVVLLNKNFSHKLSSCSYDINGRWFNLSLDIDSTVLQLVNIYGEIGHHKDECPGDIDEEELAEHDNDAPKPSQETQSSSIWGDEIPAAVVEENLANDIVVLARKSLSSLSQRESLSQPIQPCGYSRDHDPKTASIVHSSVANMFGCWRLLACSYVVRTPPLLNFLILSILCVFLRPDNSILSGYLTFQGTLQKAIWSSLPVT